MEKTYNNRIIQIDSSIIQALKVMDANRVKLLLVFDHNNFIGILTIGDIQRAIIKKIDLSTSVSEIIDHEKIYATKNESIDSIKRKMLNIRAECMPIIDEKMNLVDLVFWEDLFKDESIQREKINIPVVIMAGGIGSRLKPITNIIPKPLIPINDKTILEIIMNQFSAIGCNSFFMSVNYKHEMISYYLSSIENKYNIKLFKEDKPLGTIGSLSLLKSKICTPFFVTNCDIIIDQDYRDVYNYHIENKNKMTIITAVKSVNIPYGVIEIGENGVLASLREKPDIIYLVNTGVYILQPELIDDIPPNEFYHVTDLINKIKRKGGKIGCFPVSDRFWTDIGDWNEYLKLINN